MSRLVIVLTVMEREEGHPSYPSQSLYPAKGTTVGGGTDDPRRQHTHDAPPCHAACPRTQQRHAGLPRGRRLAHRVLSVAETVRALRGRWLASASTSRAAGPAAPDRAARRAADPGRGAGVADVGLRAHRGPPGPRVRDPRGPGHGPADPATLGPAAPTGSPGTARAPQRRDLWAAHRADAAAARPRPGCSEPAS